MNFLAPVADERIVDVRFDDKRLIVVLGDGRTVAVPLAWYPRLHAASADQRAKWEKAGAGYGIHWPDLDEDLSSEGLLRGAAAPDGIPTEVPLDVEFQGSSAVKRARYDPEEHSLDLWFSGGDRYTYFEVPVADYEDLLSIFTAGESVGEFVNRRIKPNYRHELEEGRRRFRPQD